MSTAKWTLDPAHTLIEFAVKHMMISTVKGRFTGLNGVITGDLPDLTTAQVEVSVEAASISTGDAQRDQHLRAADFFETERYPHLTLQSKRFERTGDGTSKLVADLSIHGVTKEVTFDVTFEGIGTDPWGNKRAGFTAEGRINRKDFGLVWNVALETGGILVGEQVKISVEAEAVLQA